MAQPSSPCSRAPIPKHAFSQLLFQNPSATKNLDLAAFRHLHRAVANDWQKRSPRRSAHGPARCRSGKSSDPAGGSGAMLERQLRCVASPRARSADATRRAHVRRRPTSHRPRGGEPFGFRVGSLLLELRDEPISSLTSSCRNFSGICGCEVRQRRPSTTIKAVFGGWQDGSRTRLLRHSEQ